MTDTHVDGVVRRSVLDLRPGDRVDLCGDPIADPLGGTPDAVAMGDTEHPEFEFEFEVVLTVERETDDCIRVDFESGFSCGFPVEHMIEVDGEQVRDEPSTPRL